MPFMSDAEVAEEIPVSRSFLSKVVKGEQPFGWHVATRAAKVFGTKRELWMDPDPKTATKRREAVDRFIIKRNREGRDEKTESSDD